MGTATLAQRHERQRQTRRRQHRCQLRRHLTNDPGRQRPGSAEVTYTINRRQRVPIHRYLDTDVDAPRSTTWPTSAKAPHRPGRHHASAWHPPSPMLTSAKPRRPDPGRHARHLRQLVPHRRRSGTYTRQRQPLSRTRPRRQPQSKPSPSRVSDATRKHGRRHHPRLEPSHRRTRRRHRQGRQPDLHQRRVTASGGASFVPPNLDSPGPTATSPLAPDGSWTPTPSTTVQHFVKPR